MEQAQRLHHMQALSKTSNNLSILPSPCGPESARYPFSGEKRVSTENHLHKQIYLEKREVEEFKKQIHLRGLYTPGVVKWESLWKHLS